jgi:hypothetical protein
MKIWRQSKFERLRNELPKRQVDRKDNGVGTIEGFWLAIKTLVVLFSHVTPLGRVSENEINREGVVEKCWRIWKCKPKSKRIAYCVNSGALLWKLGLNWTSKLGCRVHLFRFIWICLLFWLEETVCCRWLIPMQRVELCRRPQFEVHLQQLQQTESRSRMFPNLQRNLSLRIWFSVNR